MQKKDFYYNLPKDLIAQYPTENRSDSQLLVLRKDNGNVEHKKFIDIANYINPGDLLVINNSKVIAARLYGKKITGGKVELLVERVLSDFRFVAHIKSSKSLVIDKDIYFTDGSSCKVVEKNDGLFTLQLMTDKSIFQLMSEIGHMPLPPYMQRSDEETDQERYQTVYARHFGSVAAPTAGLHFNKQILETLKSKGIKIATVLLHVGAGTFQPVRTDNILQHKMHSEYIEVDSKICDLVSATKAAGNKVIAVGTTSVRCLETAALSSKIKPYHGETDIFIYPGFEFKVVDAMLTNFHLPESTLLMLVSAFAGKNNIMRAYEQAIDNEYRFFSYGDAMLIV